MGKKRRLSQQAEDYIREVAIVERALESAYRTNDFSKIGLLRARRLLGSGFYRIAANARDKARKKSRGR